MIGNNLPPPYPIDEKQDKVVDSVCNFAHRISVIQEKMAYIASLFFKTLNFCFTALVSRRKISVERTKLPKGPEKTAAEIIPSLVTTSTQVMDNKFYYAIREGKIWFKPIAANPDANWKLFGNNEGYTDKQHTPLIAISADGDNVVAVDQNHHIHYAKSHSVDVQVAFDSPEWEIAPKSTVSWTSKWFNMDLVAPIVNLFKDPTLELMQNARSFGISHKGTEALYYTDMAGKKHPDPFIGVTTLYVLNEDGTRIFLADPWLRNKFENEITGPEEGEFVAENMAVSASTIFLIQRAHDEKGNEVHKMYTRYADFDSIGSNPALPATYDIRNKTPLLRYLPGEDWLAQPPIPLEKGAKLTKSISIIQTGRGQDHRQLRVLGTNSQGESGFYYKNIYDQKWQFEQTGQHIPSTEFLGEETPLTGFEHGPTIIHDYSGQLTSSLSQTPQVDLKKFSERGLNEKGLHTKITLTLANGQKLEFPLHARRGLIHLLGFDMASKNLNWTLVIPENYYQSEDPQIKEVLKRLFNNKRTIRVNVEELPHSIVISPEYFSSNKFKMTFQKG
jgi:hypothetical protein